VVPGQGLTQVVIRNAGRQRQPGDNVRTEQQAAVEPVLAGAAQAGIEVQLVVEADPVGNLQTELLPGQSLGVGARLQRLESLPDQGDAYQRAKHRPRVINQVSAEARAVGLSDVEALSRSEEHTSELQSQSNLVCRLLLE